jgi:hypothetical protein
VTRHMEMKVVLAVGGAIAASFCTLASAQSVRAADDWVMLNPPKVVSTSAFPQTGKRISQGFQTPVSVSDPGSRMLRQHRLSSTARLKLVPILQ